MMEYNEVVESLMSFRRDYPEVMTAIVGLAVLAMVGLGRKFFKSEPLSEEGKALSNLLECKNRWRWGLKGKGSPRQKPTGNSIICEDASRKKVIALFKGDKYSINGQTISLSASDRKKLSKLRDSVVAHLKSEDAAKAVREQERKRVATLSTLNNVA